jgi:hypothetical protein
MNDSYMRVSKYLIQVEPELPSNSKQMKAILSLIHPNLKEFFKLYCLNKMSLYSAILINNPLVFQIDPDNFEGIGDTY